MAVPGSPDRDRLLQPCRGFGGCLGALKAKRASPPGHATADRLTSDDVDVNVSHARRTRPVSLNAARGCS